MLTPTDSTRHWLSLRVQLLCACVFFVASLLPPYVPRADLAQELEVTEISRTVLLVEDGFLMKTSPLSKQGARRAYAEGVIHTVREGDNLDKLSERYDVSIDTIRWANKMDQSSTLKPGQELLVLPVDGILHTVKRGQTLLGIAELYSINAEDISKQNKLHDGFISAGQDLIIPGGKPLIEKPVQVALKPSKKPVVPTVSHKPSEPTYAPEPTKGVLQKPCGSDCFLTQYFGASHYALDMQVRGGGPLYAAEAGTVIRADYGWNGGYGNVIEIDHGNGLVTLYAHNKELYVTVGDVIARGQNIAFMGNTGLVHGATGIHVHFEVRLNGVKKNPLLYIQE